MPLLRLLLLITGVFLFAEDAGAVAMNPLSDSLQHALSHTSEPSQRIDLLLNIKDLNEETPLNLPLSIQLFREAATVGDTYAMSIAIIPILNRYATFVEKEDSLQFYILTLRRLTPGTPQEGMDAFAEMSIAIDRLRGEYDPEKREQIAQETLAWCTKPATNKENVYHQVRRLILKGYASTYLGGDNHDSHKTEQRIEQWKQAYELIRKMPCSTVRMHFSATLYSMLSDAYTQTMNYPALVTLSNNYIDILNKYFEYERQITRRPYLYVDNIYVTPYRQLIRCAFNTGDTARAEAHFQQFRERILAAAGENLTRNKSYLYEMGCLWTAYQKKYDQSLYYCDSLINLIERGEGYYRMIPGKIILAYNNRSRILNHLERFSEAFTAYDRAFSVMDSLHALKSDDRIEAIRRSHETARLQLTETRATIRSHVMILISTAAAMLLLIAAGIYLYRGLRRNHRLQGSILRLSRKAQESERMKSNFLNSICNDIREPFHVVDQAAWKLMVSEMSDEEREALLGEMRKSTAQLLSTLDNMLEAASLGSLTEKLQLEQVDIRELCTTELLHAQLQYPDRSVEYVLEIGEEVRKVRTHARYFALVIKAMLDNAAKFTTEGQIVLRCEINGGKLQVSVSDTGPGIAPERRKTIFSAGPQNPSAGHGQSLALCSLIALHMQGDISLDDSYSPGARFIFIIPLNP